VPQDSAVLGLSKKKEHQVKIDADHSLVCRFNPAIEFDEDNYKKVEANLQSLCTSAIAQGKLRTFAIIRDDTVISMPYMTSEW